MWLLTWLVCFVSSHEQERWTKVAAWMKQRAPDAYISSVIQLRQVGVFFVIIFTNFRRAPLDWFQSQQHP